MKTISETAIMAPAGHKLKQAAFKTSSNFSYASKARGNSPVAIQLQSTLPLCSN